MLKVLGIPARKLWHVIVSTPGVQKSERRDAKVLFRRAGVRYFPVLKRKTGRDSSELPARICFFLKFLMALTGQHWKPGNSNKSTFSPPAVPDFGCLM